jgi:anti-anti-sigma regulatory factor
MKNKTFNISISDNKNLKSQTLLIEGDLCIKNAVAIKQILQSIKLKGDSMTFQLKNVERIDITFIQLIRSFRIFLKDSGVETFIKTDLNQETERLLRNAGFDNTLYIN